jgi:hypothetical protein
MDDLTRRWNDLLAAPADPCPDFPAGAAERFRRFGDLLEKTGQELRQSGERVKDLERALSPFVHWIDGEYEDEPDGAVLRRWAEKAHRVYHGR